MTAQFYMKRIVAYVTTFPQALIFQSSKERELRI